MVSSQNTVFHIEKSVTNNYSARAFTKFLGSVREYTDFVRSGVAINEYISKLVNEEKLERDYLSDFLFDNLMFGLQRTVYIRKLSKAEINLQSEQEIMKIMEDKYGIYSTSFNILAYTSFVTGNANKTELSAFKVVKESSSIKKIIFIFCEQVEINKISHIGKDHSYITIELDLVEGIVVTKVNPKARTPKPEHTPDILANKYTEKIMSLFGITTDIFLDSNKKTIYRLCAKLTNQIFDKISIKKSEEIKDIINCTADSIYNELKIENLQTKMRRSHVFNIASNLDKLIDNILLSDAFYSRDLDENVLGIDGLITYIKFNDGKNVNAVIKGDKSSIPIFDSEAFMGLRGTIENSGKIVETHINWYRIKGVYRVKYIATSPQYIILHFYQELFEGEFYDAYSKYKEIESEIIGEIRSVVG